MTNLEIFINNYKEYKKDSEDYYKLSTAREYLTINDIYTYEQLDLIEALIDYGCDLDTVERVLEMVGGVTQ